MVAQGGAVLGSQRGRLLLFEELGGGDHLGRKHHPHGDGLIPVCLLLCQRLVKEDLVDRRSFEGIEGAAERDGLEHDLREEGCTLACGVKI